MAFPLCGPASCRAYRRGRRLPGLDRRSAAGRARTDHQSAFQRGRANSAAADADRFILCGEARLEPQASPTTPRLGIAVDRRAPADQACLHVTG